MPDRMHPRVSLEAARLACEWQHEFGRLLLDEAEELVSGHEPLTAKNLIEVLPRVLEKFPGFLQSKMTAPTDANREAA